MRKDPAAALKLFMKAAEQNHQSAEVSLGGMYQEGLGVRQDYSESLSWYMKAAAQGNMDGQYNVGRIYMQGLGVSRDPKEACRWLEKAAAQGDRDAAACLMALRLDAGEPVDTELLKPLSGLFRNDGDEEDG